jgi:hypothetical protein
VRPAIRWVGVALTAGAAVVGAVALFGTAGANTGPIGDPAGVQTCQSIISTASQYGTVTRLIRAETSNASAVAYWQEHRGRGGASSFRSMQAASKVTVCLFSGEFTVPMGPPPPNGSPLPPADVLRLLVLDNGQVLLDSAGYHGHMSPETPSDIGAH